MNKETTATIFTDGSSRGNPGPGGWGSVVVDGDHVTELGGAERDTTNNRMELAAAIGGLAHTKKDSSSLVYSDSRYVINGITKWVKGWQKNGWVTKTKGQVLNRDLWEKLADLADHRSVKWEYVGGHVGILGNERCDHIATAFADKRSVKLYDGALINYDLPDILNVSRDEMKATAKKSSSSHSKAKAYSYVSMVDGVMETHTTWADCEKRVKGAKGAKYKKTLDKANELAIIEEFSTF